VTDGNGALDFFAATLYEAIPQAFVALDSESRFIYVNAKAGAILGREPASLLGRTVWDVFPDAWKRPFAGACPGVRQPHPLAAASPPPSGSTHALVWSQTVPPAQSSTERHSRRHAPLRQR
jgi:PAS domain-containing protein